MIYIYGVGNQARELRDLTLSGAFKKPINGSVSLTIRGALEKEGIESIDTSDLPKKSRVLLGIASPYYKKEEVKLHANMELSTALARSSFVGKGVRIGSGSIIMPGTTLTSNINVGKYCMINVGTTISHDTIIGDYSTICPGVNIAGNCKIGNGVFVGIGASISNTVSIADGITVGSGSVVLDDLTVANGIYAGSPAKLIKRSKSWLKEV
jgi:sugar O-acyltransferase (sialic acid O-acetyltransferase NeuD family)